MSQAAPAPHQVTVEVGGRTLTLETGKIAKQANGAVLARYGDTVVLVTACMDSKANDRDFLPLTVDYREYTYSAGKIPGGFFKREGRPSEREILTSRMIDRPLRPLFPEAWRNETQIVAMVLSADSENDPDMIGITGHRRRRLFPTCRLRRPWPRCAWDSSRENSSPTPRPRNRRPVC
jgi:polyribonucleotide nucleotidyltransferase